MGKTDLVLQRFPQHVYDPNNKSSKLYKLIEAIVSEFDITSDNINRVDKMIGIDAILPDDLYARFGALLNIPQNNGETTEQYRERLKVSVVSLSGGTAEAIRYAIASGLNIIGDEEAMNGIKIYDAWKYTGTEDSVIRDYGYVICTIDLNQNRYDDFEATMKTVIESANSVKASGVIVQYIYYGLRIIYYVDLDSITYINLDTMIYNQVGE